MPHHQPRVRRARLHGLLLAPLLLASLLLPATPPAHASVWPAPTLLDAHSPSYVTLAAGTDGTLAATWVQSNISHPGHPQVVVSLRPPRGAWSSPAALSPDDESEIFPRVAVGADGTIAVAWQGDRGNEVVVKRPGAGWSAPVTLSDLPIIGRPADLAVGADGTVTAVWLAVAQHSTAALYTASQPPGGEWLPPGILADRVGVAQPRVAVTPTGTLGAVWTTYDGTHIAVTTKVPGQPWSQPREISHTDGGSADQPVIAASGSGDLTIAWSESGGVIAAVTRAAGGDWSAPSLLSDSGVDPVVATDAVTATVAWHESGDDGERFVSRTTDGAGWSTPVSIAVAAPRVAIGQLQIAAAPSGAAAASWLQDGGAGYQVETSTRVAGIWSAPVALPEGSSQSVWSALAVGADGTLGLAWIQTNGTDTQLWAMAADRVLAARPPLALPQTGRLHGKGTLKHGRTGRYTLTGTGTGFQCQLIRQHRLHGLTKKAKKKARIKNRPRSTHWYRCSTPYRLTNRHRKPGTYLLYVRATNTTGPDPTPAHTKITLKA